jgi:hypothetical protein
MSLRRSIAHWSGRSSRLRKKKKIFLWSGRANRFQGAIVDINKPRRNQAVVSRRVSTDFSIAC